MYIEKVSCLSFLKTAWIFWTKIVKVTWNYNRARTLVNYWDFYSIVAVQRDTFIFLCYNVKTLLFLKAILAVFSIYSRNCFQGRSNMESNRYPLSQRDWRLSEGKMFLTFQEDFILTTRHNFFSSLNRPQNGLSRLFDYTKRWTVIWKPRQVNLKTIRAGLWNNFTTVK